MIICHKQGDNEKIASLKGTKHMCIELDNQNPHQANKDSRRAEAFSCVRTCSHFSTNDQIDNASLYLKLFIYRLFQFSHSLCIYY